MRRANLDFQLEGDDLGCHPSVLVKICFRLLDILANLTGMTSIHADAVRQSASEVLKIAEHQQSEHFPTLPRLAEKTHPFETPANLDLVKLIQELHSHTVPHRFVPQGIVKHFEFVGERPLDGVIHYLTERCGGSTRFQAQKIVTVEASSYRDNNATYAPLNMVNRESDLYFESDLSVANPWISVNFLDMRVTPEWYTLQSSHDYGPGCRHLKSWILEGSETGAKDSWFELDIRKDNQDLNDKRAHQTFRIEKPRACRVVRIRSIGLNHQGEHDLRLAHLELFGDLSMSEPFRGSP
jgi:hypothetical protein